jgi:glutamine synthetase
MVPENTQLPEQPAVLPNRWESALDEFAGSPVLSDYLGSAYCSVFGTMRRVECDAFHASISNLDYQWYLRAV